MDYLARNAGPRSDPGHVFVGVRSIVMVSLVYGQNDHENEPPGPSQGRVARYARGADYHRVIWRKLDELLQWLRSNHPTIQGRAVADTAPLLERDYARLAGLGWIGKNTLLINRGLGSFTFLGALLLDAELTYDSPHHTNHCGTCTRCLEACPTQAFPAPYQLDSRRCISYWTIEHKGEIPEDVAGELHGWVFGCDICQDVCPWNRKAPGGRVPELDAAPEWSNPDLIEWLLRDQSDWKARLKTSALARAKRTGLLRNAALVVGTRALVEATDPLSALLDDKSEAASVRSAAAWALGRIGRQDARIALLRHRDDAESSVREAVRRAVERLPASVDLLDAEPGRQDVLSTGPAA